MNCLLGRQQCQSALGIMHCKKHYKSMAWNVFHLVVVVGFAKFSSGRYFNNYVVNMNPDCHTKT